MPLPSLTINGFDLESFGLRVETIDGPWDLPETTDPTLVVPGRVGGVRTGAASTVAPRTITIGAKIVKDAALLAKLDTLKALFALGILELTFANQPTRVYQTRTQSFKTEMIGGAIIATSAQLTIALLCTDPIAYELNPVGYGFWSSRVPLEVGTAPSAGILVRIMGPATNPVVTIRNAAGDVVHTIGLTRALLATDYEEIDVELSKLFRVQSAVSTSDANALTSGDFESVSVSPEDGDAILNVYPTIECSGLSATGGAEISYYRGWL